jgi:hypothetical protein
MSQNWNVQWQQAAVRMGRWASGAGSWKCGRDVVADRLVALARLHRAMVMICRCLSIADPGSDDFVGVI